jgi:hypothetical protein
MRGTEYQRRIKSGAFFRDQDFADESVSDRCSLPAISQVPLWAPPCPLSAQPVGKTDAENPQVNR